MPVLLPTGTVFLLRGPGLDSGVLVNHACKGKRKAPGVPILKMKRKLLYIECMIFKTFKELVITFWGRLFLFFRYQWGKALFKTFFWSTSALLLTLLGVYFRLSLLDFVKCNIGTGGLWLWSLKIIRVVFLLFEVVICCLSFPESWGAILGKRLLSG